jgi:hypothetical protein
MKGIKEDAGLVAFCGLYCGACKAYLKETCQGCGKNAKATWCKIRSCCMGKSIRSCADCAEFKDPRGCGKFNNLISKFFGLLFRSDRRACVMAIREGGYDAFAKRMAESKSHTMKKKRG